MLATLASASLASAQVASNGNWSDSQTWSGGSVPEGSSATPLDNLSFSTSGLILNVDSDRYVKILTPGSLTQTISVDSGKILHIKGNGTSEAAVIAGVSNTASVINFKGDGKVSFDLAANAFIKTGTYNFDAALVSSYRSFYLDGGIFNINKGWTASSNIQFRGALTLNANSNIAFNGGLNGWSNSATLNVAEGVTVSGSYLAFTRGTIKGTIHATSQYDGERYAISLGRAPENSSQYLPMILASTASVISDSQKCYLQIRASDLTVNSAANSISSQYGIVMHQSKVTLNTSGAFSVKGASQENSIITLGVVQKETTLATKTTVSITLNADNNFGGFCLMGGSTLNLYTNGKMSDIGKFYGDFADGDPLSYTVNLYSHLDNTMRIFDIADENINTYTDDSGALRTSNIKIDGESGLADAYLIRDDIAGGYWINSSAVPEPSTVAAIFGILALGFVAIRRRK